MANRRIVDGKSTPERLQEELQKLLDTGERVTVVEFARRTGISYQTLTHRYRDWAEKVRKLRDEGKAKPRRHSPVTQSREHIAELDQAAEVITKLRSQVNTLSKQLETVIRDDQKAQRRTLVEERLREENERLRGVIVSLQQEIVRHLEPEVSRRLLRMIEEHAAVSAD